VPLAAINCYIITTHNGMAPIKIKKDKLSGWLSRKVLRICLSGALSLFQS